MAKKKCKKKIKSSKLSKSGNYKPSMRASKTKKS